MPAVSSAAPLPAVSSAAGAVSSQAPALLAGNAVSSAAKSAANGAKQSEVGKIQAAVNLDWHRYTLKAAAPKMLKKKTYDAYEICDEDYLVGPKILVDPVGGKIYTWTPSDTAPIPAADDKAFDRTVRTVIGTVEDGAMMNVILKTESGNELVVRRLGVDTTGLTSLKTGDRIRVTYTGVINGNDTSRAFITGLENVR